MLASSKVIRLGYEIVHLGTRSDLIHTVALARWGEVGQIILEPFLTVYRCGESGETVKTVPGVWGILDHRAEATVLMRSLRVAKIVRELETISTARRIQNREQ